jgi:hypothetical protein
MMMMMMMHDTVVSQLLFCMHERDVTGFCSSRGWHAFHEIRQMLLLMASVFGSTAVQVKHNRTQP